MTPLQQAAHAVIDRWDSPLWKDQPHTGVYIAELRKALADEQGQAANSRIASLYEELRKATDGGSESMTHDDALKQIAYWRDKEQAQAVELAGYFYVSDDMWRQAFDLQFKEAYTPLFTHPTPSAAGERAKVIAVPAGMALYGWMIEGSPFVYKGEFSELDTKDEAKRIGGTCKAFPVYRDAPPVTKPDLKTDWSAA